MSLLAKRFAGRFLAIYFVLYVFPFPLDVLTGNFEQLEALLNKVNSVWAVPVNLIGAHLFGIEAKIPHEMTGSGDMMFNYILVLVQLTLALLGAAIWLRIDRQGRHDDRLHRWLVVACRYYLAYAMFTYGFAKVIKTQFPFPRLETLLRPYGDSSPMRLAWTFMGFSTPYTIFAGAGEVLGGLLLFFRRTTTLGALVVVGVMANVFMINIGYDVPVKLYSAHLLLMAILLAALDGRRLTHLLVLNRPVGARMLTPHFSRRRWIVGAATLKFLFIGWALFQNISQSRDLAKQWGDQREKPPLWGIYDVETFTLDGTVHPPLLTDTERWQNLIIDFPGGATVRTMDDKRRRYLFTVVEERASIDVATYEDREAKTTWTFSRPSEGTLHMEGELEGKRYELELTRRDPNDFLLVNRGFHWINEFPFNR